MGRLVYLAALSAAAVHRAHAQAGVGPVCPVNTTFFPPLTCPAGYGCCDMPANIVCATDVPPCTVCMDCCHDYNATQCATCVATSCSGQQTIGDMGCNTSTPHTWTPYSVSCCPRGVPLPASTTLPNCLVVGDSVTSGLFPTAQGMLADVCQLQMYESTDAFYEASCWGAHTSAADGSIVNWDVIVYNEGLHSLWPRVNTSAELQAWTEGLTNWTQVLAGGPLKPTLIYATMTPYMPQKWCNPPGPPQTDVEAKNAAAVAAVQAAGVTHVIDRYSVITNECGMLYNNCSWCDNEAQYACAAYQAAGGFCGFHYMQPGWTALANHTATAIRQALAERLARVV